MQYTYIDALAVSKWYDDYERCLEAATRSGINPVMVVQHQVTGTRPEIVWDANWHNVVFREQTDNSAPNSGKKWTWCDKKMLARHWCDTNGDVRAIARRLGRTELSIHFQIRNMLEANL